MPKAKVKESEKELIEKLKNQNEEIKRVLEKIKSKNPYNSSFEITMLNNALSQNMVLGRLLELIGSIESDTSSIRKYIFIITTELTIVLPIIVTLLLKVLELI